jgi:hypothetical protein
MKTIEINLYLFSELNDKAQQKAIMQHDEFLTSLDDETENENNGRIYSDGEVIESIESNDYLFYEDGNLASCTTYTGQHEKSGQTELKLHGSIYPVS